MTFIIIYVVNMIDLVMFVFFLPGGFKVPLYQNMSAPAITDAKYILGENMDEDIPDLPSGPLDIYRKKASFSWKEMLRFLEGDEIIAFKVRCLCLADLFIFLFVQEKYTFSKITIMRKNNKSIIYI